MLSQPRGAPRRHKRSQGPLGHAMPAQIMRGHLTRGDPCAGWRRGGAVRLAGAGGYRRLPVGYRSGNRDQSRKSEAYADGYRITVI